MSSHARLYAENYRVSQLVNFPRWMHSEIRRLNAQTVRIHVSGDFYSTNYVLKWTKIVQSLPSVRFFGYTRSWRTPDKVSYASLEAFAALPNVSMWWSADKDTGRPLRSKHARTAYMMTDDQDIPNYAVDLLFRVEHETVMKQVLGTQVCPVENGVSLTIPLTCNKCAICLKKPKLTQITEPRKLASLLEQVRLELLKADALK